MMCNPTELLGPFQQENLKHHHQLFQLVDTVEQAAQTMLHAAEETSRKRNEKARPGTTAETTNHGHDQNALPAAPLQLAQLWREHSLERAREEEVGATAQPQNKTPARAPKRRKTATSSSKRNKDPDETLKGHKRMFVEHNYTDHSHDLPGSHEDQEPASSKSRGGVTTPFPIQLHDLLDRAEKKGYSNVISWQPHGRAFHIHDPSRFVAEVMPLYFRQTKMASFQRQLSLYGFLRLTRKSEDHGAYYNELFLRGMPHLCHRMQRTRIKGYWVRQSSSPETEPDFSKMSVVGQPGVPSAAAAPDGATPSSYATSNAGNSLSTMLNGGATWPFVTDSGQTSSNSSKVDPSLQLGASCPSEGFPVPMNTMTLTPHMASVMTQDKVQYPPMPPLKFASAAATMESGQRSTDDLPKTPPGYDMKMPGRKPRFPQQPQQLSFNNFEQYPHSSSRSVNPTRLGLLDLELEQQIMNMSKKERDDMIAFLSDVDLSGDEDSVEESYEEEAKIGQVNSSQNRRRVTGV